MSRSAGVAHESNAAPEPASPRLLLITRIWPTPDRPSAGSFVADRTRGVPNLTIVGPRRYGGWWAGEFAALAFDGLRQPGQYDGVEAHVLYPAGLIGLVAARRRHVPLVAVAHGSEVRRAVDGSRPYRWLTQRVLRGAAAVVANSESTAGAIRALGGEALVIPPGVDLSRFRPSPRPARRRVLYLGGDRAVKGYDVARELADTIAGPGLREVAPADVPALIAEHDVVLMPSRAEGFGVLAVEAIASGRWVVAAAVGGLTEIVQDGINGTLVRDDDFGAALRRIPDYDPGALPASVARFDLTHHQRAMAQLWRQVLERQAVVRR